MRLVDTDLAKKIERTLKEFSKCKTKLPGISSDHNLKAFLEQIVESVRRVKFVSAIDGRDVSSERANPFSKYFDPIRAAIWHKRQGNIDEAFWLVFLFVHFGKSKKSDWNLVSAIYAGDGRGKLWDWKRTSSNPREFRDWLDESEENLKTIGSFGNHRKYESLNARSPTGTGAVLESYIKWIGPKRGHRKFLEEMKIDGGDDPRSLFDALYQSMNSVMRFGRTARFDYLTMIGKLSLADIEPGSAYLHGATGPLTGARLLFGGRKDAKLSASVLDKHLIKLNESLALNFGMQVLEDSLCNWQKNPTKFIHFRG